MKEENVKLKFITPALTRVGWDLEKQIFCEEYFTDGRIVVTGKKTTRRERKFADYILFYKPNIPIAIIEAKGNDFSIEHGMQQALEYAEILDIPFVYSSNGQGFLEHDSTGMSSHIEKNLKMSEFPTPTVLWERFKQFKGITEPEVEKIYTWEYHFDSHKTPRYYQQIAINRSVKAVLEGQDRILLVMATGTGKTYTASQIVYRLWKSGVKKRILFLADRNALLTQTSKGDFSHFGNSMTTIKHKNIDKAYEIYLSLYQGLVDYDKEIDAYKQFSTEFFDLIIIDECHRGSASEDSKWREILQYFTSATQIGLTATPKETDTISNIEYFGEPLYTYSLRQGIDDGFLAPYNVIKVGLNVDLEGYRPEAGKTDDDGNLVEDRCYNVKDYDRNLVIKDRTQEVARRITEYHKTMGEFAKTIVFCVNTDHAARLRSELINCNQEHYKENSKYIMRITGNDEEGVKQLDNFTNVEETYPVIVTTSDLLTTGIDAKTCKLIVLDCNINSTTRFKQIIGRGTRVDEENGKMFFSIMDFRKATDLFADPDFDGDPIQIKIVKPNDPIDDPDEPTEGGGVNEPTGGTEGIPPPPQDPPIGPTGGDEPITKVYIRDVDVTTLHIRKQFLDANGKLITESLWEYTRKGIVEQYKSLDAFLTLWNNADRKQEILRALEDEGVFISELNEAVKKDLDIFDLICHIAWDQPALTRKERADKVKKRDYFTKYGDEARAVLEALLDKYSEVGIEHIEELNILNVSPLSTMGRPLEIFRLFGDKTGYLKAITELEKEIYKVG